MSPAESQSFDRVRLKERCQVCDFNQAVFHHNRGWFLCAPCAGFLVSERILPVTLLSAKEALLWLERNPQGCHEGRAVLLGQRFFTQGLQRLNYAADQAELESGEVAFLEIWQEPAWRA